MPKTNQLPILLLILILLFFTGFTVVYPTTINAGENEDKQEAVQFMIFTPMVTYTPPITNCRYGVNNLPREPGNQWMTALGSGHYINFRTIEYDLPYPGSIEHIPQIRVKQERKDGEYLPSYTIFPPLTMEEEGLGLDVLAKPGSVWMVGNEPDVANVVQDNIYPDLYATAYHEVYHYIKEIDPTAQVANGGLSMATPGRLQYLDIMWDTYLNLYGEPMPVDVWNMHLYILPEIRPIDGGDDDGKIALGTDPALAKRGPNGPPEIECPKEEVHCRAEHDSLVIFKKQVVAMRSWMKDHGQQDRPLLLSEFSLLYPFLDYDDPINPTQCFLMDEFGKCFTEQRVTTYMQRTLDYLEAAKDPALGYPADDYHLVQQWAWYPIITDLDRTGGASNLLVQDYESHVPNSPSALTQAGHMFRERAFGGEYTQNLVAGEAVDVEAQAKYPAGTADVQISLGYFNNGSRAILDPFVITFYADAALTEVIGVKKVTPGYSGLILGCAWNRLTEWTTITWKDVPIGTHTYWVKVDGRNSIRPELSEADNVVSGVVTVKP